MPGFEHACERSDAAENALFNLALYGHLSGENRARMGWPDSVRIFALRLSGEFLRADLLAMEGAKRSHQRAQTVEIPQQRKPHPLEELRSRRTRGDRLGVRSPHGRSDIPYSGT